MTRAISVPAVALALFGACDGGSVTVVDPESGALVTESRPVEGFSGVSVGAAGHLIIEQTGVESLEITAEDTLLPYIRSEVVGDELILGFESGVRVSHPHAVIYRLTVRDLRAIVASGASRVEAHGLNTTELATVVSGASLLAVSGVADAHVTVLSGASRCEAEDLRSRSVTATVSGGSYGLVTVSHALTAVLSGGSTLEYYGDPLVAVTTSGGSTVRALND